MTHGKLIKDGMSTGARKNGEERRFANQLWSSVTVFC